MFVCRVYVRSCVPFTCLKGTFGVRSVDLLECENTSSSRCCSFWLHTLNTLLKRVIYIATKFPMHPYCCQSHWDYILLLTPLAQFPSSKAWHCANYAARAYSYTYTVCFLLFAAFKTSTMCKKCQYNKQHCRQLHSHTWKVTRLCLQCNSEMYKNKSNKVFWYRYTILVSITKASGSKTRFLIDTKQASLQIRMKFVI